MRTLNESRFLFGKTVTSRSQRKLEVVAIVRGSFKLEEGLSDKPFIERDHPTPQGALTSDTFAPGDAEGALELLYSDDFAEFKPNADILLTGAAYAPNGEPIPTIGVRFAVGAWSKILRIVGDRTWKATGTPTDPKPFKAMSLDWTKTWGGAGHAVNPVGRSREGSLVPNVERADEPITDRSRSLGAASFAPINPRWPSRVKKLGQAYDAAYQRERAPWHPTDLDWSYFNAAPEDQQVPYLRGDEELLLQNLHATIPVLKTRLPGLRIRVFGKRVDPEVASTPESLAAAEVFEIPMVLDTLLVDNLAGKVVLTWRGLAPCLREDLRDVPFVHIVEEPLSSPPKPMSEYRGRLDAFAKDPVGMDDWLTPELQALRKSSKSPQPSVSKNGVDAVDQVLAHRAGPFAAPHRETIRDFLKRSIFATSDRTDLNATLATAAAATTTQSASQRPAVPTSGGGPGAMPSVRLRESIDTVEKNAKTAQRQVADKAHKHPRALGQVTRLSQDERLKAIDPSLADKRKSKEPPTPGPGVSCRGENYAGQNFDGKDLRGVDFTNAVLEKASFRGANLDGAILVGAIAPEADFSDASLAGAILKKANLSRAKLERAKLTSAELDMTILEQAELGFADLTGARGNEPILRGAKLDDAKLTRLALSRAMLQECSLERADLTEAELFDCLCIDWTAKGAKFEQAKFTQSCFNTTDFSGADLRKVTAEGCSFLKAKLEGLDLRGAIFDRCFFNDADLTGARLSGASLKWARFTDAQLRDADLRGADLFEADFTRARLDRAQFQDANAYGAAFWDAKGHKTSFTGANLKRSAPQPT
ncbi:MAG: DUF2169 domain-containing protein [Polyangiaceae bacterium]